MPLDSVYKGEIERLRQERDEAYSVIVGAYNELGKSYRNRALAEMHIDNAMRILRSIATVLGPQSRTNKQG